MFTDLFRQSLAGLRLLLVMTVLLGVGYPTAVWAAGQAFGDRADGSPVRVDGEVVGSRLIGQQFEGDEWFLSRPSANDYDTLASAPSNLGPLSTDLIASIEDRRAEVATREGVDESQVPADAVTASGSGLDPHISPAYAELQAPRVAQANGLSLDEVERLIDEHTDGRGLGFLGEPGVNVLELNVAVRAATEGGD
ncbi:potassium-transporting ATPase subunit KdpC [Microbacterium sp. ARD31]|uniref:potassium-transporting ATPase subunit KdpC n=1 Tax=Microbacterium sp. ARD31 TaxID=2962576 RepID=UPI002881BC72|nr:potassium-transporting ATPase subunit KdpC [Microbacterium sp. ARD31]MDT0187922.1 potassium-transporting ATPase subunit KdpC [Microbacterium sp. ARD31]